VQVNNHTINVQVNNHTINVQVNNHTINVQVNNHALIQNFQGMSTSVTVDTADDMFLASSNVQL